MNSMRFFSKVLQSEDFVDGKDEDENIYEPVIFLLFCFYFRVENIMFRNKKEKFRYLHFFSFFLSHSLIRLTSRKSVHVMQFGDIFQK